jgi:PDZ domain-containing protein
MTSPTVPTDLPAPPPPPAPAAARARRWPVRLLWFAVAVLVVALAGMLVRLPYRVFSPGSATPVQDVVKVEGATTYPHRGELLFLTVAVSRGRPNLWRLLQAELDDDSQVIGEDEYLGGQSPQRVRRLNEAAMDESQLVAKMAALEKLGYTVTATGSGAEVRGVMPGSPADGKLEPRDVVTAIDGRPVRLADQLGEIVRSEPAGTTFTFTVTRGGETRSVDITTAEAPAGDLRGQPYVGIQTVTKDLKVDLPVDVSIQTPDVSGPSAGLAFTLAILDEMSPGDLTGGKKVAVTGTIEPGGQVGDVGGVRQKTAAAIDAGAELFLVPRAELRPARERAGDALKVVAVDDLDDALRVLERNGGAPLQEVAPAA